MRYLDPKADLTFKKVFGEHKDIVISFLNAMLPFESPDEEIKSVEYLPAELSPRTPMSKNSIVDVRCKDSCGRQFIVEMQMVWTTAYKQRVLFNASKAYVRQLDKGEHYNELQPVYSLNILNDVYSQSKDYYHDYRIVEVENTKEVLEGLRFIFIELPKFSPKTMSEKKMQVLWLRYLTEISERTNEVSSELMENPLVSKAVNHLEVSAFTEAQLQGYDDFWDVVRTAKTNIISGYNDGMKKGLEKGREKGREEASMEIARSLKRSGVSADIIAQSTGLSKDEISSL